MITLKNLHRLLFVQQLVIITFYLAKKLKIKSSSNAQQIQDLFLHLIKVKGKCVSETNDYFVVTLSNTKQLFKIRKAPSSDLKVFGQVFNGFEYQKLMQAYEAFFKEQPFNLIDAGANVGYTTALFHAQYPNIKSITIEPSSENFKMLQYNTATYTNQTIAVQGGLWSSNAYLKIVNDFRDQSDWAIRVEATDEITDLQAFTVQSILDKNALSEVAILKMDIEGGESEVFAANADVSFLKSIRAIAIEIHDEFECRSRIENYLTEYGFTWQQVGELTLGFNTNFLTSN